MQLDIGTVLNGSEDRLKDDPNSRTGAGRRGPCCEHLPYSLRIVYKLE